jgi:hypothetical protein
MCECGLSICKRSLPAHQKSKTHESFMKAKNDKLSEIPLETELEQQKKV